MAVEDYLTGRADECVLLMSPKPNANGLLPHCERYVSLAKAVRDLGMTCIGCHRRVERDHQALLQERLDDCQELDQDDEDRSPMCRKDQVGAA